MGGPAREGRLAELDAFGAVHDRARVSRLDGEQDYSRARFASHVAASDSMDVTVWGGPFRTPACRSSAYGARLDEDPGLAEADREDVGVCRCDRLDVLVCEQCPLSCSTDDGRSIGQNMDILDDAHDCHLLALRPVEVRTGPGSQLARRGFRQVRLANAVRVRVGGGRQCELALRLGEEATVEARLDRHDERGHSDPSETSADRTQRETRGGSDEAPRHRGRGESLRTRGQCRS